MSLESQVADLTTATTNLLNAVNVSKATLDADVASALSSAQTATTQATSASASAATATTKATAAAASATAAQTAQNNAVAVVTGGTASLTAAATKIPISDSNALIDPTWTQALQPPALPTIRPSLLLDFANTKTLDPRVTFTRSSTGKYYDGSTALAEQNLFKYSQAFSNTGGWSASNITATDNTTTAPDGTTTASSVIPAAASANYKTLQSVVNFAASSIATVSLYVKANGYNYLAFIAGGSNGRATIDFATPANSVVYSGSPTINSTSVGSGWYRVTVTFTSVAASNVWLGVIPTIADPSVAYTCDGTSGLYLWGAQLEQRSTVTAYTATTSAAITNYIPVMQTAPANVARFDCDPVTGESKGLLIEQQSTNLLTYSSNFENAAWNKARCTITTAADIAPDGTQTAEILVEDTSTNSHPIYRTISGLTSGTAYTFSVYAKPFGRTQIVVSCSNTAFPSIGNVVFDISSGSVTTATNATGSISSVGNGWFKCVLVATAGASGSGDFYMQPAVGGASSYTGNGYSGIYLWGAQLEALSFPTSYIPTLASQVTRAADTASMTGTNFSSWFNAGQGAISAEFVIPKNGVNMSVFQIWDNGSLRTALNIITDNTFSYDFSPGGAGTQTGFVAGSNMKAAMSLKVGSPQEAVNGVSSGSVGSITALPSSNATLYIGKRQADLPMSGTIKRLAYYPIALTSTQLQALTS